MGSIKASNEFIAVDNIRNFGKILKQAAEKDIPKQWKKSLKAAADVVKSDAAGRLGWNSSGDIGLTSNATVSSATVHVTGSEKAKAKAKVNELGLRHPTFGHNPWVTQSKRPFLGPALTAQQDKVVELLNQAIVAVFENIASKSDQEPE